MRESSTAESLLRKTAFHVCPVVPIKSESLGPPPSKASPKGVHAGNWGSLGAIPEAERRQQCSWEAAWPDDAGSDPTGDGAMETFHCEAGSLKTSLSSQSREGVGKGEMSRESCGKDIVTLSLGDGHTRMHIVALLV